MRVRELTLTNYRAFAGTRSFKFAKGFAVIVGVNGRGKTAILDGLALVLSRLLRELGLTRGDGRTIRTSDVHLGEENAELSAKLNCAGVPLQFSVSNVPGATRLRTTRIPDPVRTSIVHGYGDPSRSDDQAPLAVYYTTDRAGYRLPKTLPASLPNSAALAHAGALINRMVDYRDLMARVQLWNTEEPRILAALSAALETFLGGFGDPAVDGEPPRLTLRKGQNRLRLEQLSDGERAFLAVIADLVRRLALANPALIDPLQGAGVVLLDEIELHLHPKWQREICDKLRLTFPNIQFIATTHSPFVIQSLRPGELINLDPEEFGEYSNRSVEDIAENVMGVDLPQKSKRYLDMMSAAERYYDLLRSAAAPHEIKAAESRLAELTLPFSDDPAFQALLKLERASSRGAQGETR